MDSRATHYDFTFIFFSEYSVLFMLAAISTITSPTASATTKSIPTFHSLGFSSFRFATFDINVSNLIILLYFSIFSTTRTQLLFRAHGLFLSRQGTQASEQQVVNGVDFLDLFGNNGRVVSTGGSGGSVLRNELGGHLGLQSRRIVFVALEGIAALHARNDEKTELLSGVSRRCIIVSFRWRRVLQHSTGAMAA